MTYNDGYSNASAGAPQLPNLLNGYAVRPPWHVAGVDYAVGLPSGTALQDWETISQPGVSVNAASHTVIVTGNNVTLNGIDFSLHGGAQLVIEGANNTTISNCNFFYGSALTSSSNFLINAVSGSNITIEHCTIDGNGAVQTNSSDQSSLISTGSRFTGSVTLTDNLLQNFIQHVLEYNGGTTLTYEYNLIYNGGNGPVGPHLNYLQWGSGNFGTATVEYNTTYQPTNPNAGGQGFQFTPNSGSISSFALAYNTMIYAPDGAGLADAANTVAGVTTSGQIYDNYINKDSGSSFFYQRPQCREVKYIFRRHQLGHWRRSSTRRTPVRRVRAPVPLVRDQSPRVGHQLEYSPSMTSIAESPASGDLNAGKTVTLTLKLSEAVTVAGGTPKLTLNDGGTATYTGGSGTNALTFSYTVGAGQNTPALAATGINLNSATVADGAGNAANLSLSGLTQSGPQIDTSAPTGRRGRRQQDRGGDVNRVLGSRQSTGSSGVTSIGSSDPTPATPTVSSFSPRNGKAAGGYTTAHVLTVTGVAAANSKVEVFNGSALLGTTNANSKRSMELHHTHLSNGAQSFNAKDVNSAGNVSAASRPSM